MEDAVAVGEGHRRRQPADRHLQVVVGEGVPEVAAPGVARVQEEDRRDVADDTATDAGYDAGTKTLTCYAGRYSHTINYRLRGALVTFGEPADASHFSATDKVVIVERDPDDLGRMTDLMPIPNPQIEGRWRRRGDTRQALSASESGTIEADPARFGFPDRSQ